MAVFKSGRTLKLHDWLESYCNSNEQSVFYIVNFVQHLITPIYNGKSQINQLQRNSLGKSNDRTLVSEFAIFTQKW